ncbi:MAG: DUF4421 family protein [Urechidicola sp.]|nr:DUF4421 family protein [Urechidicola sp.]
MNRCYFLLLFLIPSIVFTQEKKSKNDTIAKSKSDLYIKDYTNQFNVKAEFSNDIQSFKIPFNIQSVEIEPNLGFRYGVVLSYKFASVRIGIRPKVSGKSKEEKGDPKSFRIKFNLLFDKWSHRFEYNRIKGYYISNQSIGEDIAANSNHIQFPDLTTNVFSGSSAYKFNDNYSVRSTISQTEIQLKSAGSFIPEISYWYYSFDGLDKYINKDGDEVTRSNYLKSSGVALALNLGYYYTFVYKKWYANAFIIPGIGMDFNNSTQYSDANSTNSKSQNLVLSGHGGVGIGYNSEKFFFGVSLSKRNTNEKANEDKIQFDSSKDSFFVFFGYRFRAPKQITKPIDGLEERIPILKND